MTATTDFDFEHWAKTHGYDLRKHDAKHPLYAGCYVSHFTKHAKLGWDAMAMEVQMTENEMILAVTRAPDETA